MRLRDKAGGTAIAAADEFERFCRGEYETLVGSLSLFCGDPLLAEELAHEALIRARRSWEKVRVMNSPKAYVHTIGMNLARSYFRRRALERKVMQKVAAGTMHQSPSSEEAVATRSTVAALPARQKTALVLRFYLDLPIAEIATTMDCSNSTVKSLIRRGLASLRGSTSDIETEATDVV